MTINENKRKTQNVLGYDVDLIGFDEVVNIIVNNINTKKPAHIITINPEIIETATKNKELDEILRNAEIVVPDGSGIQIALKLKGIQQQRIPGVDLAFELIKKCSEYNYKLALIGAKEEVITKTIGNLKSQFSNLNICYSRNGYFDSEEEDKIINDLDKAKPDIVLVALGAPKQEIFIKRLRQKLSDSIYIGIGGSFDVWAGIVERAPELYKKIGCEWLYRTYKQPERLKRIYKTLPVFLIKAIIEAVKYRFICAKRGNND